MVAVGPRFAGGAAPAEEGSGEKRVGVHARPWEGVSGAARTPR